MSCSTAPPKARPRRWPHGGARTRTPPFSSNATIAPIATKPRATTLGGHPAWYVEVLVPSVFDFGQCDGGQLVLWQTADGDVRYALGPGELDRLWVVDIDTTRRSSSMPACL